MKWKYASYQYFRLQMSCAMAMLLHFHYNENFHLSIVAFSVSPPSISLNNFPLNFPIC